MFVVAILLTLVVLLIAFWNWDWFIPVVERQAGGALGRPVSIRHLHVRLGKVTRIVADDITAGGIPDFPAPLAHIDHLTILADILPLVRHRQVVLRLIDIDHPKLALVADASGRNNWTLPGSNSSSSSGHPPVLGVLRIEDGQIHVTDVPLKADFEVAVRTRNTPDPLRWPTDADGGEILADAKGSYARQPITARFIGGAVLSLRDKTKPYPIDLKVANGPTHVSLVGSIDQPLVFGGARLKLVFAGPDMSLLFPLTGVPIPQTPPYSVTGNLDYSRSRIVFRQFEGRVGSSDLGGTISVLPSRIPDIDARLASHRIDLADLGGFVGAGSPGGSGSAAAGTEKKATSHGAGDVLPTTPINMPKVKAANIHLVYEGDHIENRSVPLDNIKVTLNINNGVIALDRLDFAVGSGTIFSSARLAPQGNTLDTRAHVDFHRIDLSRLMQSTHAFHGTGILGGKADLTATGSSVAAMLGHGNGGLSLAMSGGGNISALLPDIAGLEFGNAILSALGLPNRADVQCFVLDMPLHDGVLSTNAFLLQTSEARTVGRGTVDFRNQTLDYSLTTRSTHFSVGSLPGPINITGKLGSPTILPGAEVAARAGAATALGVLLAPAALLPTIQFGVGEAGACKGALEKARDAPIPPALKTRHRR